MKSEHFAERFWIYLSALMIGFAGAFMVQIFRPPVPLLYALTYSLGFVGYPIADFIGKEIANQLEDGD